MLFGKFYGRKHVARAGEKPGLVSRLRRGFSLKHWPLGFSKTVSYLSSLESQNTLLAHQTTGDVAERFIRKHEAFGSASGIGGMCAFSSAETLSGLFPIIDQPHREATGHYGKIHKQADSVVVMAVPNNWFGGRPHSIAQIDERLIDLFQEGKIPSMQLPNKMVAGIWLKGRFRRNPDFNPGRIF